MPHLSESQLKAIRAKARDTIDGHQKVKMCSLPDGSEYFSFSKPYILWLADTQPLINEFIPDPKCQGSGRVGYFMRFNGSPGSHYPGRLTCPEDCRYCLFNEWMNKYICYFAYYFRDGMRSNNSEFDSRYIAARAAITRLYDEEKFEPFRSFIRPPVRAGFIDG